jgi:hypothetical protein
MRMGSTRRRAALGVAAGGVLLGHALTYLLVDPNAHQRAADLARTGHAYLGVANDLGLIAALVALSAVFLGGLTRRDADAPGFGKLAGRLVAFQVAAFACMEVVERLSAGAPVSGVLHHGILPLGIAVEAAIAVLGALVIAWLIRAADRIESTFGTAPAMADGASAVVALPSFHAPARPVLATAGIRGPPLLTSPR